MVVEHQTFGYIVVIHSSSVCVVYQVTQHCHRDDYNHDHMAMWVCMVAV